MQASTTAEVDVFPDSVQFFERQGPPGLWHRSGRWHPSALHPRWILGPFSGQKEPRGLGMGRSSFASVSDTRH